MKKIITLLLAVILIIGLVGCSAQQATPTDSDTDSEIVDIALTESDETEADTESTETETETEAETVETEASSAETTDKTTAAVTENKTTATDKNTTASTTKESTTKNTTTSTTKESTIKKTETTTKKTETTTKKSETTTKGHTHSYTSTVTTKATCTKAGVKTFKCSCGASYTESIPETGHNWKSETVHHDPVYGTRDITENWVHYAYYRHLYLGGAAVSLDNQAEMRKDELYFYKFGNKEFAPQYTIKVAEVLIKESEYQQWSTTGKPTSSLQWVYRWDNSSTDIANMAGNAMVDFENYCRKTFGNKGFGSYSDTAVKKTETKVVGTEKYIKEAAYDETIYTCTTCGAHK